MERRYGRRDHAAAALAPGWRAVILFTVAALALTTAPSVAVAQPIAVDMAVVLGSDAEPGGPAYDYRIGRLEILNHQFVAFLNDALANPGNERGAFLYFDIETGDVYVNATAVGGLGSGSGGLTTRLFSPSAADEIEFAGGQYRSRLVGDLDYADHPVTGVSWYGALKFCNWLTLTVGLPPEHRCYTEAAAGSLDGWHPVTISTASWRIRDLSIAERQALVTQYLGYRLPMDGGALLAGAYNEWYKAAAYDPEAPATTRLTPNGLIAEPFHWIYAFGRDLLTGADANYRCSGDPFEDPVLCQIGDTTPGGIYDLANYPPDYFFTGSAAFMTNRNNNYYGVFDMAGNAWEWIQGQGSSVQRRAYRGGGWNSPPLFVENTSITDDWPDAVFSWVGFRVVQADPGLDPLVNPPAGVDVEFSGPFGGPFVPDDASFTITSRSPEPFDWEVTASVAWLDIDAGESAGGTLDPFETVAVTVAPNDAALILPIGVHTASVEFRRGTELFATRQVSLDVTGALIVEPPTGLASSGPAGGPFFPDEQIYTLVNSSPDEQLFWQVTATQSWVLINGGATASGSTAPGLEAFVIISLSTPLINELEVGEIHTAFVEFRDLANNASTNRPVLVRVGLAPLTIDMAIVAGLDPQPAGPVHSYRIGRSEITNSQFLTFLNDTYLNPDDWRGQWMYHDTDSGDVYIHPEQSGVVGTDGTGTMLFDASDGGRISFDGSQYRVVAGYESEPVVGVSWFGAVKFCNWLSIRQGLLPSERVYTEGPVPESWHPVTISDAEWAVRDLNDAERAELITKAGFRLPMDGRSSGAARFNEWYKAAAWNHETPAVGLTASTGNMTGDGESSCDVSATPRDLWWTYTPLEDGTLTLEITFDPAQLHLFSVHDGCPGSVCNELACALRGPTNVPVKGGQTYWIRVATRSGSGNPFTLTIDGPGCVEGISVPSDDCVEALPVCPGEVGVNTLYGFGRDVLEGADANYWASGDPFDNSATPVGWFDGIHFLSDGVTRTRSSANQFGLLDVCGNVGEWVQDQGSSPAQRGTRGGSWADVAVAPTLNNLTRGSDAPSSTRAFTGFRIVQSQSSRSIIVEPDAPLIAAGPVGGLYDTGADPFMFTMHTDGASLSNEYSVSTSSTWLTLNADGQTVEGLVRPDDTVPVEVSFNEQTDLLLAPPEPVVDMATVPAADAQPDGPAYSFRIATYETTNEQFAAFLNDAKANPGNACGAWLYFDLASGSVYVNTSQTGATGQGPGSRSTLIFDAAASARISYDEDESSCIVESGFEQHPVTGVTWYGALKYCNWLTLKAGLSAAQRAYTEGANRGDWHSVAISTCAWWGTDDTANHADPLPGARDLNAEERKALVDNYAGYRLPMDDGAATASGFNEWYKAAAWNGATDDPYGFGPDPAPITGAYANYRCSGDPAEDAVDCLIGGTTQAGFFNGMNLLLDGVTVTVDTANRYGLYDLSGNVAEWMQDVGAMPAARATRGGHFDHEAASPFLRTDGRDSLAAGVAHRAVGFRVVQANLDRVAKLTFSDITTDVETTREVRLLLHEPMSVEPAEGFDASGMYGGPFDVNLIRYSLQSASATPMDWRATVAQAGPRWLDLNNAASDDGTLTDGAEAFVDVETNNTAATRPPGEYAATVTFENVTTGYKETRAFTLTVFDPLRVTPDNWEISSIWRVPLLPPASTTFEMTNVSTTNLNYTVSTSAAWLTLDDGTPVGGTLGPHENPADAVIVDVTTNDALLSLPVGEYIENLVFRNATIGSDVLREVRLTVHDPLDISPPKVEDVADIEWRGEFGGPFTPNVEAEYVVQNVGILPVFYEVTVTDADWLDVEEGAYFAETLLPGATTPLALSLNANADVLSPGRYLGRVSFTNQTTGHTQDRTVALSIAGSLSVEPAADIVSFGPVGGPFAPAGGIFTLSHVGPAGVLDWTATTDPPAVWVRINGGTEVAGTLAVAESMDVSVSIDPVQAAGFAPGTHAAVVKFVGGDDVPVTRNISVTVVAPTTAVTMRPVPAQPAETGGPAYDLAMAAHHITNAQFAAFLNDAMLHLGDERGAYMYFDSDSGSVYMNDAPAGEIGTAAPSGALTTRFYDASVGRISFNGATYQVQFGFGGHPVVGVSWYGALKYCNWLTLDQGMSPAQRCYAEAAAPNLNGWHAVTISAADWSARDLNDAEREALVRQHRGYRLPMDDGSGNADAATDAPDAYNEWYKAAAFNGAGGHRLYGFGRNALDESDGADANYAQDGAPFADTTPVGFYGIDGDRTWDDPVYGWTQPGVTAFTVQASDNYYQLDDMTGNAFQWMQGRYNGSPDARRTLRGGSWAGTVNSMTLGTVNRVFADATMTHGQIGFRVVRSLPLLGDLDDDGDVDLADLIGFDTCLSGPEPATGWPPACAAFDLTGDDTHDLEDFAQFQVMFTGPLP